MEYSYYPGCSLKGTARDYAKSVEVVVDKLGLKLYEIPEWTCCGASPSHIPHENLNLALPALTLASADKYGKDLITVCAACFNRLKNTQIFLNQDPEKKSEIEKLIENNISGKSRVRHFLEVVMEDIKEDVWQSSIKKKLSSLKTACYYGCLLTRPKNILPNEKMEAPEIMDNLMEILGASSVHWSYKTECCGTSFGVSKPEVVLKLSGKILKQALKLGADCLVVACPLCHSNLDLRQKQAEEYYKEKFDLPIFYFPELIALALGVDYRELALDKHIVDPVPMLERKGLI